MLAPDPSSWSIKSNVAEDKVALLNLRNPFPGSALAVDVEYVKSKAAPPNCPTSPF